MLIENRSIASLHRFTLVQGRFKAIFQTSSHSFNTQPFIDKGVFKIAQIAQVWTDTLS